MLIKLTKERGGSYSSESPIGESLLSSLSTGDTVRQGELHVLLGVLHGVRSLDLRGLEHGSPDN